MSHLTTVKTKFKDAAILEQAINNLIAGLAAHRLEKDTLLKYFTTKKRCDFVVRRGNLDKSRRFEGCDFGLVRNESGEYELVYFDEAQKAGEEFQRKLVAKYGELKAIASLKEQNFQIESVQSLEDGSIKILAGKW